MKLSALDQVPITTSDPAERYASYRLLAEQFAASAINRNVLCGVGSEHVRADTAASQDVVVSRRSAAKDVLPGCAV